MNGRMALCQIQKIERRWIHYSLILVQVFLSSFTFGRGPVEDIRSWIDACDQLRTYDANVVFTKWIQESDGEKVLARESKARCRYRDGMWRIDIEEDNRLLPDGASVPGSGDAKAYAFDGKVLRYLNRDGDIGEEGSIKPATSHRLPGPMPFEVLISNIYGVQWTKAFAGRANDAAAIQLDGVELDRLYRFPECTTCEDVEFSSVPVAAGFDAGRSAFPSFIAILAGDRPMLDHHVNFEDPRFPSQYTSRIYGVKESGDQYVANEWNVEVLDYVLNAKIPLEVFRLEFPEGTRVYSEKENANFIAGESGERDYEAYQRIRNAESRREKGFGAEDRTLAPTAPVFLYVSLAVLLVLPIGYWCYRRRASVRR